MREKGISQANADALIQRLYELVEFGPGHNILAFNKARVILYFVGGASEPTDDLCEKLVATRQTLHAWFSDQKWQVSSKDPEIYRKVVQQEIEGLALSLQPLLKSDKDHHGRFWNRLG